MGLGGSKPVFEYGITREQLLKSTERPRDFTNKLFQIMLSKLTPEDFLKLSNPSKCKEYVFMMADSINRLFEDLRIRPKKLKDSGVVLFQKIDKLRADTTENKELCLTISYFYIRIFQLFGSLAMTVLDDPRAGSVLSSTIYENPRAPLYDRQQQGFFARPRIPGTRGPVPLYGGASERADFTGKAQEFAPLRELFESPEFEITERGIRRAIFRFIENSEIEYIPERMDAVYQPQNLRIYLEANLVLYANMSLKLKKRESGFLQYTFVVKNISFTDSSIDPKLEKQIQLKLKNYSISFDISSLDNGSTWQYTQTKTFMTKFTEIINTYKQQIQSWIQSPETIVQKTKETAKEFIYDSRGHPIGRISKDDSKYSSVGSRESVGSRDVGSTKALQNQYIIDTIKAIAGNKSVSFCIARAFQLLDANSQFRGPSTQSRSGVCAAKFDELPTSVPQSGRPLDSIPGLKAFDQLYYTRPSIDTKESYSIQVGDGVEYSKFLADLGSIFGKPSSQVSSLDKIFAKDPNCAGTAAKHYLQIQDPKKVVEILAVSKQLFKKQLDHTNRVIQFFKNRLFVLVKKSGSATPYVDIHPKLLQGGIFELEAVSKEVRTILIEYYKGCEETYQKGVQIVLGSKYTPI
jgi:hypothetical protein